MPTKPFHSCINFFFLIQHNILQHKKEYQKAQVYKSSNQENYNKIIMYFIYLSQSYTQVMQAEVEKLFNTLEKINQRYGALFFRKLIISTTQTSNTDERIRNYDLQCEGAEIISAIFNTKVTTQKLKAFHKLKMYNQVRPLLKEFHTPKASRIGKQQNHLMFTRSSKNTMSQSNFKNVWYHNNLKHFGPIKQRSQQSMNPQLSQLDCSFQQLMQKVKCLNHKLKSRTMIQKAQEPTETLVTKTRKRKAILQKLHELEHEIDEELKSNEGNKQYNRNYMTTRLLNNSNLSNNVCSRVTDRTHQDSYIVNVQMTP